jgi:hypothetical protein
MKRVILISAAVSVALVILAVVFLRFSGKVAPEGSLIFTQVSVQGSGAAEADAPSRIAMIEPGRASADPQVLTKDFHAAASPSMSYDGRKMVFAARKTAGDTWQIWEMDLSGRKTRQITSCASDCIDPVYLPDGRIAFSRRSSSDNPEVFYELVTCKSDGSDNKRITHHPGSDVLSSVLSDGRIVVSSLRSPDARSGAMMLVMRPDGTKTELYYRNPGGWHSSSRFYESPDGRVVFTETDTSGASQLVAVSLGRPLGSRTGLSEVTEGDAISVYPVSESKWVVAWRKPGQPHSGLYYFDVLAGKIEGLIHEDPEWLAADPVAVGVRRLPRVLPSPVDEKKETGAFICLDADNSDLLPAGGQAPGIRSSSVQLFGTDGMIAEIPLLADGSFYADVPADTPIRFQTIDEKGAVVRGPSAWVWVRPNERRGCVGCHENRELAPDNRLPLAILGEPGYSASGKKEGHDDEDM